MANKDSFIHIAYFNFS